MSVVEDGEGEGGDTAGSGTVNGRFALKNDSGEPEFQSDPDRILTDATIPRVTRVASINSPRVDAAAKPERRRGIKKQVSFNLADIDDEYIVESTMLSPAMLSMSMKRTSITNPPGVSFGESSFLRYPAEFDPTRRRSSAASRTSNHSTHSNSSSSDETPMFLHGLEPSNGQAKQASVPVYSSKRRFSTNSELSVHRGKVTSGRPDYEMLTQTINYFNQPGIKSAVRDKRRSVASGRRPSAENILEIRRKSLGGALPLAGGGLDRRETTVQPHQYTEDPTLAWEMLKAKRPVKKVIQMKRDTPIKPEAVRFVCLGCTHGEFPKDVPAGDVLIVTGDFTTCGLPKEVKAFNTWLGQQKHAYKVIIAGNHECTFDEQFLKQSNSNDAKEHALKQALNASLSHHKLTSPRPILTNAIYLQASDSLIELFGITIYGTPWQPRIDNWAFNLPRGVPLLEKWNQIPSGVDVLVTHTPPVGHGDTLRNGQRAGCVELLNSVTKRIKPKYHVYSHIHEGYGCTSDGYTKFINCCLCDENLQLANYPVIFDIPVHPHTKQHYLNNVKKIMKRFTKKEK